jgi:hypothetical protein
MVPPSLPQVPAKKPRIGIALICLAASPFVLLWALNFGYIKWEESHDIKFDRDLWMKGDRKKIYSATAGSIDAPRIKMYRDLIQKGVLIGKTKPEILELLGESDDFPFRDPWGFNYWLGLQRGPMKMDSAWLAMRFDGDGRVAEVKMMQD